jgi:acyl carrier protein
MAAQSGDRTRDRWSQQGLTPMSTADALLALEMTIAADFAHVGVLTVDWDRYATAAASESVVRPLGGLLERKPGPATAPPAIIADRLRRVGVGQRGSLLQQHVRDRALSVLGLEPAFPLDPRQGLRDVGLDSLLAIELRNALQSDVQASLPATLAFDYPTVEALAAFLAEGPLAGVMGTAGNAVAADRTDAAAAGAEVASLSDDEAEALLLAELAGYRQGRN